MKFVYVALGGAVGSILRYLIAIWTTQITNSGFPSGTFIVNVVGAIAIGFFWALADKGVIGEKGMALLVTGVLGGFTTFSTFALESQQLLKNGDYLLAAMYTIGTLLTGIVSVVLAIWITDKFYTSSIG